MTYDRAAIMRNAWRLRRKSLDPSTVLCFSWAQAKADRLAGARPGDDRSFSEAAFEGHCPSEFAAVYSTLSDFSALND